MALANVAWILASAGKRVLAIDWDLEAPGLNRYLHPFLTDKELATTPGLLDFLWEFVLKARDGACESLRRLVPALYGSDPICDARRVGFPGRRCPASGFCRPSGPGLSAPGGTVRLEHVLPGFPRRRFSGDRQEEPAQSLRLRADRQPHRASSDTSGICAVQMPDDLVCCFTMNSQNILGTAAVTDSAFVQRIKPNGEPGLIIWPVPTRVEAAERDRLDARASSRARSSADTSNT